MRLHLLGCALAFSAGLLHPVAATSRQAAPVISRSGLELSSLDRSVNACVDFYQFACGGWIAQHPIPANLAGIGRARELRERTFALLRQILANPQRDRELQKASDYYTACMDERAIDSKGIAPLRPVLSRIAALNNRAELAALLAFVHGVAAQPAIPLRQRAYAAFFDFSSDDGPRQQLASVNQGGIALPDRNLYVSRDERSQRIKGQFAEHVRTMFVLLGMSAEEAIAGTRAVIGIETALAAQSADSVNLRALDGTRMSIAQLQDLTPHFDWTAYLKAAATPPIDVLQVTAPAFLRIFDTLVDQAPLSDIIWYLQWQVVHSSVLMLPADFRHADFEFFKRTLRGQAQSESRSELCLIETDDRLGDILGKAFVEQNFGPASKATMLTIMSGIRNAMNDDILATSWMSTETKTAAQAKLNALVDKVGYPERWRDYSALRITRDDALGNLQRALTFERQSELARMSTTTDREEWPTRLSTARGESGYWPERNQMMFPAGILQPPLYSSARDAAVNYGAVGAVMGHEVTHGFDDIGRRLDSDGRPMNWWTATDAKAFQERTACFVDQYSQYAVADGSKVNGRLTLGENIADNGGVRLALMAYLAGPRADAPPELDGFTPEQRFFLGWAQLWCANVRPEAERLQVTTDPHAPNRARVNGPLSNMKEFQDAFSCKPGAPMVRANSCRVW